MNEPSTHTAAAANPRPRREGTSVLRPLSIAPMMDRTYRHYRAFMRQLTTQTLLYTEMITANAVIHGDRDYLIGYDDIEHPVSLQLGGSDPIALAECARIAEDRGYDEVNLNVGCPSDRVQSGSFGAVLMLQPDTVARCVEAMLEACTIPVTVKHRIGVDEVDSYEDMVRFVKIVSSAGCEHFSVHARKAWLNGLSPKENRNVPPLRYEEVHRLKADFPHLRIEINGGITTLDATRAQLQHVDAVMIGRAAWDDPWMFASVDTEIFGLTPEETAGKIAVDRHDAVQRFLPYIEKRLAAGDKLHRLTRHLLHLFHGQPGTRRWKQHLTIESPKAGAGIEVVEHALSLVPRRF